MFFVVLPIIAGVIGIISFILPVIALVVLWGKDMKILWWTILILFVVSWKLLGTGLQEQVRVIKKYDKVSEYRGWFCIITSLLLILLSLYAIIKV